tara:strand:+ start:3520 stop:3987 length:468 start_codon:yes stop_codon:yes gene_type:complete
MISFDLKCKNGHQFEGWFASSEEFKKQSESKLISCAACGSTEITKALMAPNVSTLKKKSLLIDQSDMDQSSKAVVSKSHQAKSPELHNALKKIKKIVEENCDYVGENFAEEARKISYGESKERNIYGEASADEAQELYEEGIEFGVLPWPNREDA